MYILTSFFPCSKSMVRSTMKAMYSTWLLVVRIFKCKDTSTTKHESLSRISIVLFPLLFNGPYVNTFHYVHCSIIVNAISAMRSTKIWNLRGFLGLKDISNLKFFINHFVIDPAKFVMWRNLLRGYLSKLLWCASRSNVVTSLRVWLMPKQFSQSSGNAFMGQLVLLKLSIMAYCPPL